MPKASVYYHKKINPYEHHKGIFGAFHVVFCFITNVSLWDADSVLMLVFVSNVPGGYFNACLGLSAVGKDIFFHLIKTFISS